MRKNMKELFKSIILLVAVLMTACQDNEIISGPENTVNPGDEIVFNAVSGYKVELPFSRTLYSGATYTENGVTYERVEWEVNKDIIGIYCENANNVQYADYRIIALDNTKNQAANESHHAILARHEQSSGLQWGTGEHEFFAIYPSPTIPDQNGSATSLEGKVKLKNNILTGYVPTTQTPIEIVNGKDVTNTQNGTTTTLRTATKWAKPDMRYSYMIARTTATPADKHVDLSFKPISTALEIDINTGKAKSQSIVVTSVTIQSISGRAITGNFTCPINADGTPDSENIKIINGSSSLTIQLGTSGITLAKGNVLRVTALLLPTAVTEGDLRITISGNSNFGGDQTGVLKEVSLQAHKKHYIANLPLKDEPVEGNNWITRLDDDILLGGLSIPGAANAFSLAYYNEKNPDDFQYYRTQSKSFTDLWNMGVRCFELVSDRPKEASTSLGGEALRCNNAALGSQTVDSAIDEILEKLAEENSKNEFAMVILTYQPQGGWGNPARNPSSYMSSLRAYYDNQFPNDDAADRLVLYSPTLTVGNARGKLMIVARPSQEGEDSDTSVNNAIAGSGYEILTVKGWGTLMDKWYKRGYDTMIFKGGDQNGERTDVRAGFENFPAMEDWIYGARFTQASGGNYYPHPQDPRLDEASRPGKKNIRFNYASDQTGINVWAQEWRRVVNLDTDKDNDKTEYNLKTNVTIGSSSRAIDFNFFESFAEKKADILATYNKAISDESRSMVYFNSLDGFYMLTNEYKSYGPYWVGNMGNIRDYAIDVNTWFYNTALKKAEENGTGTMGVIIMDYIGENLGDIHGELLPKAIYNNNFKSTLPKAENPEQGGGGTQEPGGDDDGGFGGGTED